MPCPEPNAKFGRAVVVGLAAIWGAVFAALPVWASSSACLDAIDQIAAQTPVPAGVLRAIAFVESGLTQQGSHAPWPWSTNQGGTPRRYSTMAEAIVQSQAVLETGVRNLDIGCFQINYRWHSENFSSLQAMFDPETNAAYAAHYLTRLFDDLGSWDRAIGAYHSRDADRAKGYLARVQTAMAEQPLTPQTPERGRTAQKGGPLIVAARSPLLQAPAGSLFATYRGAIPLISFER